MFPIKYIENNLVFNHDGECFAYYELIPYNYSFLSPEEKYLVHDNFRQLIAQSRDGKIHALQISTESSIRTTQERSKKEITGRLYDVACEKIDQQTQALVDMIGENQIDYRFFVGFKLLVNEEEIGLKGMRKSAVMSFADFIYEVNHKLMGDFVSMSNDEISRYMKMEKLLENKISRRFKFRRLEKKDAITNFVWTVSLYISNATGYVVQEAYKLDFISDTADAIGKNIQTLAGVTSGGFSGEGFYVGFLLILILVMGIYVAYTGLIKRETTKAVHAVVNFLVVFLLSASMIACAPDYIAKVNGFSADVSNAKIVLPDSDSKGKDSVALIRDSLFSVQVKQPWLLLQYGESDIESLGADRIEELLSASPDTDDREDVVVDEMQSSESLGLPPNSLSTEESIRQGCKYFSELLKSAKASGCDINTVVQAYNYGGGFIGYVAGHGKKYTFELAVGFAREKSGGVKVSYKNEISIKENGGWRYRYGNMFYVKLVLQYLAAPSFNNATTQKIFQEALKYQGWKYVFGGSNPNTSFDCSGLVQWCYGKAGIKLPRTAQMQYDATQHIPLSQAKAGDLVFFHSTYNSGTYVTHVGIYAGNNRMYHAGNPIGYADLTGSYWQKHLIGAGRVKTK